MPTAVGEVGPGCIVEVDTLRIKRSHDEVERSLQTLECLLQSGTGQHQLAKVLAMLSRRLEYHHLVVRESWLHNAALVECPRLGDAVRELERTQRSLEERVRQLTHRCSAWRLEPVAHEADRVGLAIRSQNELEGELLQRALYEDIGGSG